MERRNDFTAPPMGWNSWNTFYDQVSEELICSTADAMVSQGLAEAGYRYVIIDDCWAKKSRDEHGNLEADPEKFPPGPENRHIFLLWSTYLCRISREL